ncbi:MAG: helix-turn-helix domain-containing protein [Microcoleus sp. T3-bin5]|nr:helix-turn-helix domain-containing protein [Microcoleus sp. T3-bin5]MBD0341222.1 helix-turn-helix domain-containing protein [Microcoleus sp. Co-bin12]
MPQRLIPQLTDEQKAELEHLLCHSPKPYLRERASAILKLSQFQTVSEIACSGLLRKRHRETVSNWFHRFQIEGIKGLQIKAGRGRKAAFSPSAN